MTFEEADKEYPYDPQHEGHADRFHGLDKLRAFNGEKIRRAVYYAMTDRRDRAPGKLPEPPLPDYRRARSEPEPPPEDDDETRERYP